MTTILKETNDIVELSSKKNRHLFIRFCNIELGSRGTKKLREHIVNKFDSEDNFFENYAPMYFIEDIIDFNEMDKNSGGYSFWLLINKKWKNELSCSYKYGNRFNGKLYNDSCYDMKTDLSTNTKRICLHDPGDAVEINSNVPSKAQQCNSIW